MQHASIRTKSWQYVVGVWLLATLSQPVAASNNPLNDFREEGGNLAMSVHAVTGCGDSAEYSGTMSSTCHGSFTIGGILSSASADLATGQLKTYAEFPSGAVAAFYDTLTFTGVLPVSPIPISSGPAGIVTFNMAVDGRFVNSDQGSVDVRLRLFGNNFSDHSGGGVRVTTSDGIAGVDSGGAYGLSGGYTANIGTFDSISRSVDVHLNLTGYFRPTLSDNSVTLVASLFANPGNLSTPGSFGAVDFQHTAALSIDLPTGVTYTSDSGVFLANLSTAPVPEPETYAMMLAGLGLLRLVSRRQLRRKHSR